MRTSTSFAILALLASAGTSLAAPVKGDKYGKSAVNVKSAPDHGLVNVHARVVTEVSLLDKGGKHKGHGHGHEHGHDHGHRDVTPGVIDNGHLVNGNQGNNDVGPLPPVNRPINAHSADTIHPVTGGKDDMANVKPVTSDKMLKDDKIAILPNDPVVKGKDGMVDIQQGNLAGHVIQTPGKDKTIAEIQAGDGTPAHKSDVKVNVPIDGPAGGLTGLEYGKNGNIPSQLLGKQAGNKDTQVLKAKPLADVKIEGSSSSPPHPKPTPSHASQNHGNPKASSAQNHPSQSSKAAPSKSAAHAENAKPPSAPTASSSSTNGAKPATSSKATNHSPSHDSGHSSSAHQSSASPPKPSQSAAGSQGKDNGQGGKKEDDDNFNLNSGAFRPTRPGKGGNENGDSGTDSHNDSNHHETKPQDNNGGKNGPTRLDNGGDGHTIGLSSSTRRGYKTVDLQIAKVQIGELPERVQPCDPRHYSHGEAVDICIEADLLAYAPKHTFKCPDELQHDIHIHEDTAKDGTINSKLGKQVAKYVRLCVDAGVL